MSAPGLYKLSARSKDINTCSSETSAEFCLSALSRGRVADLHVVESFIRQSAGGETRSTHPVAVLIVDLAKIRLALDVLGTNLEEELMLNCARRAFTAFAGQGSGAGKPGRDAALAASPTLLGRGNSGELIIVISKNDDLQFLQRIARKIIAAFSVPVPILGHAALKLEASVGIARLSSATEFASGLLSSARLATRAADERGSGHYAFFQAQQRQRGLDKLNMQAGMPGVMARGDLHMHYQPKIDLASGKIVGVEALVRARNAQGDSVNPQSFIEAAEQCGMIEDVGRAALQMAIDQCGQWHDLGFELPVAINASALQFARPGFSRDVLDRINAAGLPPHLIEIELTETAATANVDATGTRIAILRKAGVKVAIDDFGTGYANLAQFAQFDFDTLKFDRSLIELIGKGPRGDALLAGLLAMAATVGHQVVAEGVETPEQRAFLVQHGCPIAQGYLFARPMPPADFTAWIESTIPVQATL